MSAAELARALGAKRAGREWRTTCPLHDDARPSLEFRDGERGIVFTCRSAGCDSTRIAAHYRTAHSDLSLSNCDAPAGRESRRDVASYDYTDETGALLYQVVRFEPKDFRQRRPDGKRGWFWNLDGVRRVLYRLPRVLETAKAAGVVYVVEGEKDVEALEALGLVATCNAAGAGKWRPEYAENVHGIKGAVILPDKDPPGRAHALDVARSLHAARVPVKLLDLPNLPERGDVSDWIAAGGTKTKLIELAKAAPLWEPGAGPLESEALAESEGSEEDVAEWPEPLDEVAMIGPLGDLVRVIAPQTESDPAALLLQAVTAFGSVIGRTAHYVAEADRHFANVNVVLVGATSKGRKGTSWGRIASTFGAIDPAWSESCIKSGLSSGEGLIFHVRDGEEHDSEDDHKAAPDPGVSDKRLLILEPEFASVLRVLGRDGNTLSAVVRQAWDMGKLNTLTKNSPTKATGAHVSIVGHITVDELRRYLDRTEAGNGFANRFLWACVKRSRVLPFGGDLRLGALDEVGRQLAEAVRRAQALDGGRLDFDPEARELWAEKYEALSDGRPGMLGAVTSRSEAQTVRLALIYALADCSPAIRLRHLAAALEVWLYCEDSAEFIFGNSLGDPLADELLRLLQGAGSEGVSRDKMREHFKRHRLSGEIGRALRVLAGADLARTKDLPTGGRPEERWYAVRGARKARKARKVPSDSRDTALMALTAQSGECAP